MEIFSKELGAVSTNVFVAWDQDSKDAIVIDTPQGACDVVQTVVKEKDLNLKALLLTHGHWDHIADASEFQKAGVKIYAHKGDNHFYNTPMLMSVSMPLGVKIEPVKIDYWVEQGDIIELLNRTIEVRHVSGHAPGNVLFYFKEDGIAFVGDAIFAGSIGRYDLPGGSFEVLEQSIKEQIYTLPEKTVLYPGHGPLTKVGYEMKHNPYVTV